MAKFDEMVARPDDDDDEETAGRRLEDTMTIFRNFVAMKERSISGANFYVRLLTKRREKFARSIRDKLKNDRPEEISVIMEKVVEEEIIDLEVINNEYWSQLAYNLQSTMPTEKFVARYYQVVRAQAIMCHWQARSQSKMYRGCHSKDNGIRAIPVMILEKELPWVLEQEGIPVIETGDFPNTWMNALQRLTVKKDL